MPKVMNNIGVILMVVGIGGTLMLIFTYITMSCTPEKKKKRVEKIGVINMACFTVCLAAIGMIVIAVNTKAWDHKPYGAAIATYKIGIDSDINVAEMESGETEVVVLVEGGMTMSFTLPDKDIQLEETDTLHSNQCIEEYEAALSGGIGHAYESCFIFYMSPSQLRKVNKYLDAEQRENIKSQEITIDNAAVFSGPAAA